MVNGVAGRDVELATIPLGTGMDFGRTYGIPTKFDDAVRVALEGDVRTIDAGRVTYRTWAGETAERYFANVSSVGMSGAVAQRANGMSKALGGKVTFFYALTRVFLEWQNTEVTVRLDDAERRGRMHDVIVANGVWHGGGMKLAPDAAPDDGQFDVVLIGDVSKVDFLTTAPKIYKGKHVHHPKVEVLRSTRVEVDAPVHLPIELEGEQVGTTPATFEVAPGALRVRVPRLVGGSAGFFALVVARFCALSSFLSRASSSPIRFSIPSSPRTRFERSSTRSFSCVAAPTTRATFGFCDALPITSSPRLVNRSSVLFVAIALLPVGLGVDYHLCPRWDELEQSRERVVREPDAAVRDRTADRPRLVRAVDRDRPALRPAGQDGREGRDADRARPERAARVVRDEPLVDVVAADRRRRRGGADRDGRLQHAATVAEERELPP